ncbi:MAG: tetratricopeptide repeat protein, partial [Thermodesulfobacteriota bacterium]
MSGRPVLGGLLLLVLAHAFAAGCGWRKVAPPVAEPAPPVRVEPPAPLPAPSPPAPAPALPPPLPAPPVSAADKAVENGMAALQDGGFERALELFSSALKEKPGHAEAAGGFDEALVGLKKAGDAAYAQGKPEDAGKRWMGTLRHIGSPAARGRAYPFTRADVKAMLDKLTASQMEKGLLNYRKGDIPAAIAAWKTILAYDPENEEATRAVRTASTPLENHKKIPPAGAP